MEIFNFHKKFLYEALWLNLRKIWSYDFVIFTDK